MSTKPNDDPVAALLKAALTHVPFDGWSEATFKAAISDSGLDAALARTACPRGAVDLAVAFHSAGDKNMLKRIKATDMNALKIREKISAAVRFRLEGRLAVTGQIGSDAVERGGKRLRNIFPVGTTPHETM